MLMLIYQMPDGYVKVKQVFLWIGQYNISHANPNTRESSYSKNFNRSL